MKGVLPFGYQLIFLVMNRTAWIWTIVVIIIIGLGIWYFASGGAGSMQQTATTTVMTDNSGTGTTGSTSGTGTSGSGTTGTGTTFHSIFTQSGNHECTYAGVSGSTQIHSLVDIADGKMYGEFRTLGATSTADLMIYTGGTLYTWKEGATTGKATSIKTLADLPDAIPQDLTSGAIFGVNSDNVSWDCHDWAKDASKFTLPSYVKFQ